MKYFKFISLLLVFLSGYAFADSNSAMTLLSPNKSLALSINLNSGQVYYDLSRKDEQLIKHAKLGFKNINNWQLESIARDSKKETWQPVWGKRSDVENNYNELVVKLKRAKKYDFNNLHIALRLFDDGLAFRYIVNPDDQNSQQLKLPNEISEFNFTKNWQTWTYAIEKQPIGPKLLSEVNGLRKYPMMLRSENNQYMAITEAKLRDIGWMELFSKRASKKVRVNLVRQQIKTPFEMPWRVLLVTDNAGDLIDSDLIANLNARADKEEYSWVKPGVSFWDWRAWGHKTDDFTYDLQLPSWKRFIDLAQEQGVPYLVIDADWYGPEFSADSDPFTGGKSAQVQAAIKYGQERGVGLVLYLNHVAAKKYGIAKILHEYSKWGAAGVKYGFMRIKDKAEKVKWTHNIVKMAGDAKLLIFFHDNPIPPTGEEVTWPHFISREFNHAQSDGKRASLPSVFPGQAFVNMITGPLDMNNGLFDLNNSKQQRPRIFQEVYSTIVSEAARNLIVYSGLTIVPDSADAYRKHPILFDFIAAQKMPWLESKTLSGDIDSYISMMRQTQEGFLVATVNNETSRELTLKLDFLTKGVKYKAVIAEDTADTHYLTGRENYQTSEQVVSAGDIIIAKLAPGGGQTIQLTPIIDSLTRL